LTALLSGSARILALWAIGFCAGAAVAGAEPPAPPWVSPLNVQHPLVGRIWAQEPARYLTPPEMVENVARATFVLLGEKHDNGDHHRLQAWLTQRMVDGGRRPAVAFEMFGTEQTPALADYQRAHPGDAAGMGAALHWEQTGWPDWDLYAPIAQAAARAGLPVVAANLPHAEAVAMARGLPLSEDANKRLGLDTPLADGLAADLAREIRDSHCGRLPEEMVLGMVLAQRARDAAMATAMVEARSRPGIDGAVLIAGAGHVRSDRGVPLHLRRLAPGAAIYTIVFVEVQPGLDQPTDYAEGSARLPFDAVWFTPRLDAKDPCASLRKRFQEK